jgi:hypothetical protein
MLVYTDIQQCIGSSSCKYWRVTDKQLARHMGLSMYQAFYQVVKSSGESPKYYDFERDLLKPMDEDEVRIIAGKIRKYRTCDYLGLWREVKASLATSIVIITMFDWIHYQAESCKLVDNSDSLIEYVVYSLTFITKWNQKNAMLAQDILNYVQRHRCLYPTNVSIKVCLGVEPVAHSVAQKQECTLNEALANDSSGWEFFWWTLAIVVIIFIIMWVIVKLAEAAGRRFPQTYGPPLVIRRVDPFVRM